jgi:hypothetical protein
LIERELNAKLKLHERLIKVYRKFMRHRSRQQWLYEGAIKEMELLKFAHQPLELKHSSSSRHEIIYLVIINDPCPDAKVRLCI